MEYPMYNLIILYNPYYQQDVIVHHVNVLVNAADQNNARVAFGKVRSKLRSDESFSGDNLSVLKSAIASDGYLQLFLTDYADMYVAKVIEVTNEDCSDIAPSYYREKGLDVEAWFILADIRQIVDNDFQQVRDRVLGNMTTPSFGNHHFAVYGNQYRFPLEVTMDTPIDYFADAPFSYYVDIFKSPEYIATKHHLIDYRFGEKVFYALHPNSQESVISAEIEYAQNRHDKLYDFSAVVIKYSKAVELELYLFVRPIMMILMKRFSRLKNIEYKIQSKIYHLSDLESSKPNIGTYKFLFTHYEIKNAISEHFTDRGFVNFLRFELLDMIEVVQKIRNEAAHGKPTSLRECEIVRANVIGIAKNGLLGDVTTKNKRL